MINEKLIEFINSIRIVMAMLQCLMDCGEPLSPLTKDTLAICYDELKMAVIEMCENQLKMLEQQKES